MNCGNYFNKMQNKNNSGKRKSKKRSEKLKDIDDNH